MASPAAFISPQEYPIFVFPTLSNFSIDLLLSYIQDFSMIRLE